MNFDEMAEAVQDADRRDGMVRLFADRLAVILLNRLRDVSGNRLSELKRKLKNWDTSKQEWK